jgi:Carboxypeptidase regulatory-like domain
MKSLSPMFAGSFGLAIKRNGSRLAVLLAAFFVIFAAQALAQEATIVGTVTDPSGAAVANAKVTVTNLDTNIAKNLTTNDAGQYTAVDIHIGHYNIKVETSGFKTAERKDIVLQVGDRARADFQLAVGGSAETVTVEANTIAVQADSGEVSNVITGEQIANLSINGRGIYQLAALAPGASSQIDVTAPNTPVGGSASVEYNGLRQNHNIYLLDGGENDDRGGAGGMSIAPSADAIAEFRTLTSNYSADYGLSSAGTNVLVLKSGTKSYHAAAWEFNRNNAFDANTYNNRGKSAELRQNTYGFNGGGPVDFWAKEHKTFFFYNMEWRKYINGGVFQTVVPPNGTNGIGSDWYTGDLSSSATTINVPSATQVAPSVLFANCPGGTAPVGITQGQPFPTNKIPTCMISPNATALLNAGGKYGGIFPAPTGLDSNGNPTFFGGNNSPTDLREVIVRVDHNFSSKFSVFGHYVDEAVQQTFGSSLWNTSNTPVQGTTFGNPSYSAVIHTTYAISPTLLNEAAFNYNGNRIIISPIGLVSGGSYSPHRLFSGPNSDNRLPNINLQGSTGTVFGNNSWPWYNKADDYQLRDDISWTKGAHQFKFGGSWAIYKKAQDLFGNTQGAFNFGNSFTGLDFSDFLLGLSTGYNELAVQDRGFWNNVSTALYFQDNWRVNKRLTLNLGLRWDGVPHTYEAKDRMGNFYPLLYDKTKPAILDANGNISPTSPDLAGSPNPILKAAGTQFYLNGIGIPGTTSGVPKGLVNTNWAAFGPRVGFAYDLTGSGKTVVRGGFGMMYERIQGNDMYNAGPNIPFSANVNFSNVSLDNPSTYLINGQTAVAPITVASITGLAVNQYKLPVAYQYSVGVQHSLASRTVLSVMYVGNQSREQNYYQDINLPDPSNLLGLMNHTVQRNTVNPYQGFGSISMSTDGALAHYNGLQVDLNSQIRRDLSLRVFYTLSRSYDPTTGGSGGGDLSSVSNPYAGPQYDAGRSGYDRLHNLSFNFIYDLPFLRHSSNALTRTVVGGWEVSGIVTIESGVPYNVTLSSGLAIPSSQCTPPATSCGTYDQGGNGVGGTNRPDKVGAIVAPHTKQQWATASAFAFPTVGAWGNFAHNSLDGPGRDNWNMSLFKNFVFSEARGSQFELRLETFNTFNHPQISGIATGWDKPNSTTFGVPNGFFPGRIVQLGGKITF